MNLADAIDGIHVRHLDGSLEKEASSVHFDSRQVTEGAIFCALKGVEQDGMRFVQDAVDRGAVAIVSDRPSAAQYMATWIQVGDARSAMAKIAANLEDHPSYELPIVGITGTNGKTTTSFLVHHLMQSVLRRAGMIGTIYYSTGDEFLPAPHTTPESTEVQHLLRQMIDADCRAAVMEVSSHGLAQHRVDGVAFDVGVFTNLSQDHLDYHRSMDEYYAAKRHLFELMSAERGKAGVAIINADDSYGQRLLKEDLSHLKKITYGRGATCDFLAADLRQDFRGTQFTLRYQDRQFLVKTPLIGAYNVYNVVAALAVARALGFNMRQSVAAMATAPQVPGRLEAVGNRQTNYRVFVDYAHTPDALTKVLETLRALQPRRIITVFGCGGDRDRIKRPLMAAAVEAGSDWAVLTSDNPRTEDPDQIIDDVAKGFSRTQHEAIADRRNAIRRAVELAGERDIVLIAGKGHETYQEIQGVRHDFDDRRVATIAINRKAEGGFQ